MRKILLALATAAILGASAFAGTAQADHGWYGGYRGYGRGFDCYPGYHGAYYHRPHYYHGHGHHHHHHHEYYGGGGVHVHGRGFGIHLGF